MRTFLIDCSLYLVGALVMARYQILLVQGQIDQLNDWYNKLSKKQQQKVKAPRLKWDSEDYYHIWTRSIFWFFFVVYYSIRLLMFPRGIKSKFAREQEKVKAAKAVEARAAKAEEDLRKMQDEVLRFMPHNSSFDFSSSWCTMPVMPVMSSSEEMLMSCGEPSVPGTHHCRRHLVRDPESAVHEAEQGHDHDS